MTKAFAKKIKKQAKMEMKAAVSSLNNLTLQKKAYISLIASNALCEYLKEQEITIISKNNDFSSLFLLKDFDIANITVENNLKIAVRAFVGDDYPQMCIPKNHFSNNILADIYVGVRLESSIDKAEFVGFIGVDKINRQKSNDKYVFIDAGQLNPIDSLKQVINSSGKHKNSHTAFDHKKARDLFYHYIDGKISSLDKEFFARHISSCIDCNQEFSHVIEIDNIIKATGHKFNFEKNTEDYTLKLFAGDPILLGEKTEINIAKENDESTEKSLNQKKSKQKKKKQLPSKKIGKTIKAAGKLALLSGTILGSGHIVSALQAASISGSIVGTAIAMSASSAQGISKTLSSISEHFDNQTLSNGNEPVDNEIVDSFDLNADETNSIDELFKIDRNGLITEEANESFLEPQSNSSELTLASSEEFSIKKNDEDEVVSLHQNTPEVQADFSEVQDKEISEEILSIDKAADLDNIFDDVTIEYNIDDILSSFDNVEVVDSSDFFDFEDMENESPPPAPTELKVIEPPAEPVFENILQEGIKQDNELKENTITEIYEDNEDISEESQEIEFNSDSENEESSEETSLTEDSEISEIDEDQEDFEEVDENQEDQEDFEEFDEDQYETAPRTGIIDLKLAAGIAAAGITVAIAVALWINHKSLTNQNLPILDPRPINQVSSLPSPTDINNKNLKNTALPPEIPTGQQQQNTLPIKEKDLLHLYQKKIKPAALPATNKDLSSVLAEAFTRQSYDVDIRNVSWEITADMAENPIFKNYIMVTGQALKSALARDLSLAKERALNTQMELKTVMDLNGNILVATVIQSSGSKEVDKICLETYKTTIQFTKLPKMNINKDKIKANLIISF